MFLLVIISNFRETQTGAALFLSQIAKCTSSLKQLMLFACSSRLLTATDTHCNKTVLLELAGAGGRGRGLLRCSSRFKVGIYIHSGGFTERFLHIRRVHKATRSSAGEMDKKKIGIIESFRERLEVFRKHKTNNEHIEQIMSVSNQLH